jgi:hypothetical protein
MARVAAIEEMYLIYQAFRQYLTGTESLGDFEPTELMASYRSFCQREPVAGMFLESVVEEMLDRVKDGGAPIRYWQATTPRRSQRKPAP